MTQITISEMPIYRSYRVEIKTCPGDFPVELRVVKFFYLPKPSILHMFFPETLETNCAKAIIEAQEELLQEIKNYNELQKIKTKYETACKKV
jgi:hypothetical protein